MFDLAWIKISTTMCDDEKLKLINAMPERDTIFYIWIRLLQQAGKTNDNGYIYLNENMAYTKKMLSIIFDRPVKAINRALKALVKFNLIDIEENNFIRIVSWEKNQNVEGIERIKEQTKRRVAKHREKKKLEEQNIDVISDEEKSDINSSVEEFNTTEKDDNKIINDTCNVTKNKSNVTDDLKGYTHNNECNVTVTNKNKIENQKKINNKNKREKEKDIEEYNIEFTKEIREKAEKIIKDYEKATGKIGWLEINAIKIALLGHTEEYVRLAIDKAIESNKFNVKYIIGILRNWKKEGYPDKSNNKLKFNNFESRQYDYDELERKLLGW